MPTGHGSSDALEEALRTACVNITKYWWAVTDRRATPPCHYTHFRSTKSYGTLITKLHLNFISEMFFPGSAIPAVPQKAIRAKRVVLVVYTVGY